MSRSTRRLAVLVALVIALAGCGGESSTTVVGADDPEEVSNAPAKSPDYFGTGAVGRFDLTGAGTFTATASECDDGVTVFTLDDGETADSIIFALTPINATAFATQLVIHGDVVGDGIATIDRTPDQSPDRATAARGTFEDGATFTFDLILDECDPSDVAIADGGGDEIELPADGGAGEDAFPEHGGDDGEFEEGDTFGFVDFGEGVLYNAFERSCTTSEPEPGTAHVAETWAFEIYASDGTSSFVMELTSSEGESWAAFTRHGDSEPTFTGYEDDGYDGESADNPGYYRGRIILDDGLGVVTYELDFADGSC